MLWPLITFGWLLTITSLHAQPAWKSELTSSALGPHPGITSCFLDFKVSWKGLINSGTLKMEFAPKDAKKTHDFIVRSSASSLGTAAALFPYQSDYWSELDPKTFKPRYFHATEKDKKESITTIVRFWPDRVETQETSKLTATGKSSQTDEIFKFTPVFDIFSAMLHVRSQTLAVGDKVTLVVCPFKSPMLLRITVISHETHNGRDAIRLNLGMQKIKSNTLELKAYKKLKKDATLWLSNDADRIPVEFRAAVFIGDVRATLSKYQKF